MSTELATVDRVSKGLAKMSKQFESTLPSHISPAKFLRAAVTAVQNTPDLQEAEYKTVISACQKAAQDGLIIDNREAALVVFNKKNGNVWEKHAQYMPMVAGILKKARNSGQISNISSHAVYENDFFEYELGLNPKLIHKPTLKEPGELKCAYAIANLKDGSNQFEVMNKTAIMDVAMSSKSGWDDKNSCLKGIWKKWESEMWRKTVLKRLCKYIPSSSDLDEIVEYDNEQFSVQADQEESAPVAAEPAKKAQTKAEAAILDTDDAIDAESTEVDGSDPI